MPTTLQPFETTVDQILQHALAHWPGELFVAADGVELTYAEVGAEADRLARGLVALGIAPGDRVALWMSNLWEWVVAQFAVTRCGAVLTPLNTRLRSDDLAHALRDSGARFVITQDHAGEFSYLDTLRGLIATPGRLPALEHVVVARGAAGLQAPFVAWDAALALGQAAGIGPQPATDPHALAYILYTSGTTSLPKGVMLSHANLNNSFRLKRHIVRGENTFLVFPLFAITGCHNSVLSAALVGSGVVLQERFDPVEAVEAIERYRCVSLGGIVSVLPAILQAHNFSRERVASLRHLGVFPRRPQHVPLFEAFGNVRSVSVGYGMTETAGPLTFNDDMSDAGLRDEGLPWPGNLLRIVDAEGHDVPDGTEGEILAYSPQVMLGYFNQPAATAKAIDAEGWLHTGDVGRRAADGRITWVGRQSDVYKSSGFNVAAAEVEAFLAQHPAIADVAVIGVPDDDKGEVGAAFVILRPGSTLGLQQLRAFCAGHIASYKIPGHVVPLDSFPKTTSGKVRKIELRKTHFAHLLPAPVAAKA